MFEICAMLAPKKNAKVRKDSGPKIGVGVAVVVHSNHAVVVGRDAKYSNAWLVRFTNGKEMSFPRDMIVLA